jgi:hypothetical protein
LQLTFLSAREGVSSSGSESSSSDSPSSSDSDSEGEGEGEDLKKHAQSKTVDEGDEDEEGGALATTAAFRTKNELSELDIMIPTTAQIGPDEQLERVGEIMNIVNNVVIVKGVESGSHRALDRALDTESLLVYEDRRVLGYVSTSRLILLLTPTPFFKYPDPRDIRADVPAYVSSQVQQLIPVEHRRSAGVPTCVPRPSA